jgi:peptidoglycan/LPS O-acetylase OafA/YrhL
MAEPAPGPSHTPHIARLDVLRALAFLGVYTFHMTGPFPALKLTWNGNWFDYSHWPAALYPLVPVGMGWLGVPLFFVLSGFCIHYSTLKRRGKGKFSTDDFYWRRWLRIYPTYFVCVIVCALLAPWLPIKYFSNWQEVTGQLTTHLLMIHNLVKMTFEGINGPMWSLGVEAQFYLLYPFLLLVMRRRLSWGQCLCVALALNFVIATCLSLKSQPYEMTPIRSTFSFPLVTWCDWILGAMLAEAYVEGKPLFSRPNAWLVGSGAMLLLAMNFRPLYVQSFLFSSVFFAVVMQRYLARRTPLAWVERALVPIGLISYSLYLWHQPVQLLVMRWGQVHGLDQTPVLFALFNAVVASAILFPLAWLSYRAFETAVPRWLAGLVKKKSAPPVADAAAS